MSEKEISEKEIRTTIKNITGENTQDNNKEDKIKNLLIYIDDIKILKTLSDEDTRNISNYKNIIKTYLQKIYKKYKIKYNINTDDDLKFEFFRETIIIVKKRVLLKKLYYTALFEVKIKDGIILNVITESEHNDRTTRDIFTEMYKHIPYKNQLIEKIINEEYLLHELFKEKKYYLTVIYFIKELCDYAVKLDNDNIVKDEIIAYLNDYTDDKTILDLFQNEYSTNLVAHSKIDKKTIENLKQKKILKTHKEIEIENKTAEFLDSIDDEDALKLYKFVNKNKEYLNVQEIINKQIEDYTTFNFNKKLRLITSFSIIMDNDEQPFLQKDKQTNDNIIMYIKLFIDEIKEKHYDRSDAIKLIDDYTKLVKKRKILCKINISNDEIYKTKDKNILDKMFETLNNMLNDNNIGTNIKEHALLYITIKDFCDYLIDIGYKSTQYDCHGYYLGENMFDKYREMVKITQKCVTDNKPIYPIKNYIDEMNIVHFGTANSLGKSPFNVYLEGLAKQNKKFVQLSNEVKEKLKLYKKNQEYKKEIETEIKNNIKKYKNYDFEYFLNLREHIDEIKNIEQIEKIEKIKKKIKDHIKSIKGAHELFKIIELRF